MCGRPARIAASIVTELRHQVGNDSCVPYVVPMRALILNGALRGDEALTPVEQALDAALTARGWRVDRVRLRERSIVYCKGCFECWTKTPGICGTKDDAGEITRAIVRSDLLVLLTPITFGGYSSELKKALDRSIGAVLPFFQRIDGETHHEARYARYPPVLAVGVAGDDDAEERQVFATLVARNAINLHAPAHLAGTVMRTASPEQIRSAIGGLVADIVGRQKGAA